MDGYNPKYSAVRPAGREHVPLYPKGFIALRIVQLILSVLVIGLCGFGVWGRAFAGDCLMLFVGVATMISTIYLLVSHYGTPNLYNYWAVLSLDIFLLIFWLISFALLASDVAAIFSYGDGTYYDYITDTYYSESMTGLLLAWSACLAAAAGLGGVEFALFVTSLAIHSVALHRHRKAGLHCTPVVPGAVGSTTVSHATPQAYQPVSQNGYMNQSTAYDSPAAYDPVKTVSPMPHQQSVYPPPVTHQQQQPVFPQAPAPAPLNAQPTGGSFAQPGMPMPYTNTYEVPSNQMHH